tara:strand:- start:280 stop:456 length:177 start_codon:yes stop_codon:yes gene_type:complete
MTFKPKNINDKEDLKKIMTLEDYTNYLSSIEYEDFYQIEVILKKYNFKMVVSRGSYLI